MNRGIVAILAAMLLFTSLSLTASASLQSNRSTRPLNETLYVGGSGPENYTTIQAAVDNATDGDTVFVYDDSSPYTGDVCVGKPLTLQGEDKATTIIDHGGFSIKADHVSIMGFRIQNGLTGVSIAGPSQSASYALVEDNIFLNMTIGVNVFYGDPMKFSFSDYGYNQISNNVIRYSKWYGIRVCGRNNIVTYNDVSPMGTSISPDYGFGIRIDGGAFCNVSHNTIAGNPRDGIYVDSSYKDVIYRNDIRNNSRYGVVLGDASWDQVLENNLIGNRWDARLFICPGINLKEHFGAYPLLPSKWSGNYWEKARSLPHPIGGLVFSKFFLLGFVTNNWGVIVNFVRFDFHPAQTPYEI